LPLLQIKLGNLLLVRFYNKCINILFSCDEFSHCGYKKQMEIFGNLVI